MACPMGGWVVGGVRGDPWRMRPLPPYRLLSIALCDSEGFQQSNQCAVWALLLYCTHVRGLRQQADPALLLLAPRSNVISPPAAR